eukprot:CAMPEP_0181224608 /NCGR_PEP_ID=MMETSP1096-20121128/31221_1 /TAXON_ID=156174 ORGANISM="Chrysochromulina ericina, Strain CCMP281" /NCGR_SAMPLE_ID=MMETSP1096 /ASSEMBLY_ACC=CAM_ASM_000453 /LENGTH=57 /DNA_ID=CAMNT_0023317709 /DNA_START=257 /DNA_END=430 /DNA_ORIENTATION=-
MRVLAEKRSAYRCDRDKEAATMALPAACCRATMKAATGFIAKGSAITLCSAPDAQRA